jgi:hypothetical protein
MTIGLPALAASFAAFCVWLAVRIVNRRERWAKRTLAIVLFGTPALYVLSFGPACWFAKPPRQEFSSIETWNYSPSPYAVAPRIYWPLGWLIANGPEPLRRSLLWYVRLGGNDFVLLPARWSED